MADRLKPLVCSHRLEFESYSVKPSALFNTLAFGVPLEGGLVYRSLCGKLAEFIVSAPLAKVIVKGNSDFAAREHARLTERSQQHHRTVGHKEAKDREVAMMDKVKKQNGF